MFSMPNVFVLENLPQIYKFFFVKLTSEKEWIEENNIDCHTNISSLNQYGSNRLWRGRLE